MAGKLIAASNSNLSETKGIVKLETKGVFTHKQISQAMNNQQIIGTGKDHSKEQESPNLFLEKLGELKKKFDKTG